MLYDYYLNGNLRTREVAEYYVGALAARRELPHNTVWRHRMTGGSLRLFAEAYRATWKPEYLSILRQCRQGCSRNDHGHDYHGHDQQYASSF